jgi:serine O-acetyltransferase
MFENLSQDLRRCGRTNRERLREVLFNPGTWAVIGYRYCRWVHTCGLPRPFRWPLSLVAMAVQLWVTVTSHVQIPSSVRISPGLLIPHTGYIVLNSRSSPGANCTLTQGVTLGHAGGGGNPDLTGAPVLGDRVYVGPGTAVIGRIEVGDDALVGVGAVVTRAVPPRGVVAGNPARVLSLRGSFDLVWYPGMEDDPARRAALEAAGRAAAGCLQAAAEG